MSPRLSVFLVEDNPSLRLTFAEILSAAGYRVEAFDRPEALLSRLSPADRGGVVLDLRMPELHGLELQRALEGRGVVMPLVFVSMRVTVSSSITSAAQGAIDFLSKPIEPAELLAAVERVQQKDAEAASERATRDLARARWDGLSPRETDVCRLIARGLINKQIAAELGTTESTVQAQRTRALKKLGVRSAVELVRLLVRLGESD